MEGSDVAKHMHLVKLVRRSIRQAVKELCMAPSWGVKWCKRYEREGLKGLRDRSQSGRPPKVHPGIISKAVFQTPCWTLWDMREHIHEYTGVK